MRIHAFFSACALTVLAGCPTDEGAAGAPQVGTSAPAATESATTIPDGMVGVATCDAYVTKMRACIDKLPEADREARRKSLDGSLAAFREQARRPETKANLETTCKAAMDALASEPLCK
jgi:hypothetical protein